MKLVAEEKCFLCGHKTKFFIEENATLLREAKCTKCGASKRNSDTARSIVQSLLERENVSLSESRSLFKPFHIYEACSNGHIHDIFKHLPHYQCSEYFDDVPRGQYRAGVRSENLEKLSFPDEKFDLVLTEDVLEHVADPINAFREIKRVLKPGGYHIFTVPVHEGRETATRALKKDDKITHLKPPVYHGDPIRKKGILVYTDFSEDIIRTLNSIDMHTEIKQYTTWHKPEEVSFVGTDAEYESYLKHYKQNTLFSFFKYNSLVFVSKKKSAPTGERYMLEGSAQISYEHWHRYLYATRFVKGKTVLDIASGEGYGSELLAQHALSVVGVDISDDRIKIASDKYDRSNLIFKRGTAGNIPIEGKELFDVIVSFETIEHLHEGEQQAFLNEVKRLLKPSGLLIVSTPNKLSYSDIPNFKNEYHVKEFYVDEFKNFLNAFFKNVRLMGQNIYPVSYIWDLNGKETRLCEFAIEYIHGRFIPTHHEKQSLYVVALCSDRDQHELLSSVMADLSEKLVSDEVAEIKNSWSWRLTAPLRALGKILARTGK